MELGAVNGQGLVLDHNAVFMAIYDLHSLASENVLVYVFFQNPTLVVEVDKDVLVVGVLLGSYFPQTLLIHFFGPVILKILLDQEEPEAAGEQGEVPAFLVYCHTQPDRSLEPDDHFVVGIVLTPLNKQPI